MPICLAGHKMRDGHAGRFVGAEELPYMQLSQATKDAAQRSLLNKPTSQVKATTPESAMTFQLRIPTLLQW